MIPFNPTKDAKTMFTGKNRFLDSKNQVYISNEKQFEGKQNLFFINIVMS